MKWYKQQLNEVIEPNALVKKRSTALSSIAGTDPSVQPHVVQDKYTWV